MSLEAFDHAVHTANTWLSDLARELGAQNRRYAYRMLRAWLHTLRDRLPVNDAAKFSAQLPELLRGMYFEGWEPSRTPVKYSRDEYVARFALQGRIPASEVPTVAPAVTRVFARRLSPGQLEEALAHLPVPVREVVAGPELAGARGEAPRPAAPTAGVGTTSTTAQDSSAEEMLAELQARVDNLTEAVRVMAEGLEDNPLESAPARRPARSARLASEILMTGPAGRAG